jgi:hypothetical protein
MWFVFIARLGHQRVWFGAAFAHAGLRSVRTVADLVRSNGRQQRIAPVVGKHTTAQQRQQSIDRLQRSFETDAPRLDARSARETRVKRVRTILSCRAFGFAVERGHGSSIAIADALVDRAINRGNGLTEGLLA